ncbi:hypothetical protein DFP72DRAFT_427337 [Ephemerocybe angulata]|uniref:Uncharacterized protein n=1 Tax=Ephemerocybe angulata TaxID=980116 RepID=A0A8H6M2L3_9AGAR|nr:hypothetical protein DFP72DRAFT_427337 [Tulosesus angulatus]
MPHIGLILAIDDKVGMLAHVKYTDNAWVYEYRKERIMPSMTLTSLRLVHDSSKPGAATIVSKELDDFCKTIEVPSASMSGQCGVWVAQVLQGLVDKGAIAAPASGVEALLSEFATWAKGNRSFATRSKYPNIKV